MRYARPLHLAAWAAWVGSFSLYFGVVAPTARRVLGHPPTVGLITQQVSWWFLGTAVALAFTALRLRSAGRGWTIGLGLWIVTTVAQIALHPLIDQHLSAATAATLDQAAFRPWHHVYLIAAMLQWGAGIWLVWLQVRTLESTPSR